MLRRPLIPLSQSRTCVDPLEGIPSFFRSLFFVVSFSKLKVVSRHESRTRGAIPFEPPVVG